MEPRRFVPQPKPLPEKPRKVRGGIRLAGASWPVPMGWAATNWINAVTTAAGADVLAQGIEYARGAQTRTLSIEPGRVLGEVQGRAFKPLRALIEYTPFTDEQWHAVEAAMSEQAVYAAKLLAHEVPENIQDVFAPLGLSLYPGELPAGETKERGGVRVSCTCGHPHAWCKHLVCVALLLAERLDKNPFLIFTLRGLPGDELIERLRSRRAATQGGDMFTQSLAQRLAEMGLAPGSRAKPAADEGPSVPDDQHESLPTGRGAVTSTLPLDACLDAFWDMGPGLAELDTPLRPPEVTHALLRRLGPSPFKEGKFPLVGLLATCYETISKAAIEGRVGPTAPSTLGVEQPTTPAADETR